MDLGVLVAVGHHCRLGDPAWQKDEDTQGDGAETYERQDGEPVARLAARR